MKTTGIIAEFNPFHNGHLHLLNYCKNVLGSDHIVIVMSGDFVQRGTPALVDKFVRTKMAIESGADLVLELPTCYATGSAEYFANGAVSVLDKLGCVDQLVFGSECGDIDLLTQIAQILVKEPAQYKETLSELIKQGSSFPVARQKALLQYLSGSGNLSQDSSMLEAVLSSPNNILGIEYIKALLSRGSSITPVTITRIGEDYNSTELTALSSASGIRSAIAENGLASNDLDSSMPLSCLELLRDNAGRMADVRRFSDLIYYKLLLEKDTGYTKYLDVTEDLSNKIAYNLEKYQDFDQFCSLLKSKDIAYSRISRCLTHIILGITTSAMDEYKSDNYASFVRVLGMRADSSAILRPISDREGSSAITNIKNAEKELSPIEYQMFKETLFATELYNSICPSRNPSEYRLKQIIYSFT
jgi:predicted nucleotidyltransferase